MQDSFSQSGIPGIVAIWREALCTGPTSYRIGTTEWLSERMQHLSVLDSAEQGQHRLEGELQIIQSFRGDEVVLWFEYDLFCQINMFAALAFLFQLDYSGQVTLVCAGRTGDAWLTLGQFDKAMWQAGFNRRWSLQGRDLEFANQCWSAYCSDDHAGLSHFATQESSVFPYLALAIRNHFLRFPSRSTGLTEYEISLLEILSQNPLPLQKYLRRIFEAHHLIGYGDLQHLYFLQRLHPLCALVQGNYTLTEVGIETLQKGLPKHIIISRTEVFGGCLESQHFVEELEALVGGT